MPSAEIKNHKFWPYFILSGLFGLTAVIFMAQGSTSEFPAKSDLVKISGEIATVAIRDDFSNSSAGAMLPAYTSVYFTLKGIAGEFRYPFSHPKYYLVRDNTSDFLDVWVEGSEIGAPGPMIVWQLQEHSPNTYFYPNTSISYEDVISKMTRADRSTVKLGRWLALTAAFLALVGLLQRRRNNRQKPATPIAATTISTDWSRKPRSYTKE